MIGYLFLKRVPDNACWRHLFGKVLMNEILDDVCWRDWGVVIAWPSLKRVRRLRWSSVWLKFWHVVYKHAREGLSDRDS